MDSAVNAVKKFQGVALIATACAITFYAWQGSQQTAKIQGAVKDSTSEGERKAHSLSGEEINAEEQSSIAKALDTDCEYCLDTRRQLFGMFKNNKESGGKAAGSTKEV